EQLKRTIAAHPEDPALKEHIVAVIENDKSSVEDLFSVLPGHRLQGAWLPRDSKAHWLMALGTVALFFCVLMIYRAARKNPVGVLLTGLFTGTVGIVVLLLFQWAAEATRGVTIHGGGRGVIIFLIIRFIGFSYSAAMDPQSGL